MSISSTLNFTIGVQRVARHFDGAPKSKSDRCLAIMDIVSGGAFKISTVLKVTRPVVEIPYCKPS